MLKKVISCILIFIILALWMPIQAFIEVFTSYAVTTEWEFNYKEEAQELTLPYKGIYQIEAIGAKGGTADSHVVGGNGSHVIGSVELNKHDKLTIYTGGTNGYNGGGSGNSLQGNGGGASDVRLNGKELNNRILVAAGGGGSYATPNYHQHKDSSGNVQTNPTIYSSSNPGGCYRANGHNHNAVVTCPVTYIDHYSMTWLNNIGAFVCPTHGIYGGASPSK